MKRGAGLTRRTPLVARTPLAPGKPLGRTAGLTSSAPLLRTSRIKPRPAVVTAEERAARKAVGARAQGRCEGCGRIGPTDWSHRVGRAQGGPWSAVNGLALCSGPTGCHRWSHDNVAAACSVGWILRSTQDPPAVPALLHGIGLVQLTADGGYIPIERNAA